MRKMKPASLSQETCPVPGWRLTWGMFTLRATLAVLACGLILAAATALAAPDEIVLNGADAELVTDTQLRYNPKADKIQLWSSEADRIRWKVEVEKTGKYIPTLHVSCASGQSGSEIEVRFNGEAQTFLMPTTVDWDTFDPVVLQTASLKAGVNAIEIQAIELSRQFAGDIRKLVLEKVE